MSCRAAGIGQWGRVQLTGKASRAPSSGSPLAAPAEPALRGEGRRLCSLHVDSSPRPARLFSALQETFRPGEDYPRAASGVLISCAHPCHRAPDGADGSVLREEEEAPVKRYLRIYYVQRLL